MAAPPLAGRFRVEPEDFSVEEVLGFDADGSGNHVLLLVEKRDANTGWVAAAACARGGRGTARRRSERPEGPARGHPAVLFAALAGRRRRSSPACRTSGEGYRVLAAQRHGRKLRPGSHRAQPLRHPRCATPRATARRSRRGSRCVGSAGVPNYFGPQRYGRDGGNLARARDWAAGGEPPRDRMQRGFALSAARSELFNLRAGGARATRRLEPPAAGRGGHPGRPAQFLPRRRDRCGAGRAMRQRWTCIPAARSGDVARRRPVARRWPSRKPRWRARAALRALLEAQGLDQERRSLRLPVRSLEWRFEGDSLVVSFELPRGTFATSVLHEVLQGAWDPGEGGE